MCFKKGDERQSKEFEASPQLYNVVPMMEKQGWDADNERVGEAEAAKSTFTKHMLLGY